MRFFFRSRQFRIIVSVFLAVVLISLIFGITGSHMSPGASLIGTVTAPIREVATDISGSVKNFFTSVKSNNDLLIENAELKAEIEKLRAEISKETGLETQNEFYKSFLGLKEDNPDFNLTEAYLVSRDSDDPYGSFTINKGSAAGIHKYDPVITGAGLAGYVSEVGITTSKVTTLLCPDLTLGALGVRTNDSGIVTGELKLAKKGLCKLSNLSRNCSVAIGDYIKTSGEGIFPEGLLIGTVENIGSDKYNASIYAEIKPFTDFSEIKGVMVITDFEGKGGISVGKR